MAARTMNWVKSWNPWRGAPPESSPNPDDIQDLPDDMTEEELATVEAEVNTKTPLPDAEPSGNALNPIPEVPSAEQQAMIDSLREEMLAAPDLTPEARAFLEEPSCVKRFAISRGYDVDKTRAMLQASIAWRASNIDGREHVCSYCRTDPGSHCFFPIGFDRFKRPVVYACQPRAKINGINDAIPHMAFALENIFKLPDAAEQWAWVVDFNGFGMRHATHIKVSATTVMTFANNYPERMGAIILLDPPRAFQYMFSALYPFIDPKTRGKIVFLRGEEKEATLRRLMDKEMVDWLLEALSMAPQPCNLPPLPSCAPAMPE